MKKLLIATAIGLAASFAPAASVQWTSGTYNNGFVDHNGASLYDNGTYTMTVLFYSDSEGKSPIVVSGDSVDSAKPNGQYNNTTSDSFESSTESKTMTYYVKAIIQGKDSTGADYYRESALASFTMGVSGDKSINFTTGGGFDVDDSSKWAAGGWKEGKPGPEPVPEPTSGLLMVLGLSALALRRKRA